MGESLNPSPLTRLWHGLRPDWTRTIAARRLAAAALVVLAAIAAMRPDPSAARADVLVAARDLKPGVELTADDFTIESRSATTIPDGARTDPATLIGATLAGPARRGEVLTDVRILGSRLAEASAGPDARVVPLHVADPALLELIRPGDVVDVLAVETQGVGEHDAPRPRVVARGAIVVLVSPTTKAPGGGAGVVLVALPAQEAIEAAGASLSQAVTLTFH
jgi:Flp pilus assembly protein CpaB